MKLKIKLFAIAKQFAGQDELEVELQGDPTVGAIRTAMIERLPELASMGDTLRLAVNSDYADDATVVQATDELACIPPVSGG